MECAGCGSRMEWPDHTVMAFTCPCGAILFNPAEGFDKSVAPVSLLIAIAKKRTPAHIDYYLGRSSFASKRKDETIAFLRSLGSVWSWECKDCKPKVVERTKYEMKERLYPFSLHPELANLVSLDLVVNG